MNARILNRDFQHPVDGWYQIEAPGEHANAEAGVVQVIDSAAVNSIVNRFNLEADDYEQRTDSPFPGMLVDHEHFASDPDKESRAYGWLLKLQNRGGVPFGQIRWTSIGQQAVDGGEYRFFSSEYNPNDLIILNIGNPTRVRPMRLAGLSLTNAPNNKGGAPITNRNRSTLTTASSRDFRNDSSSREKMNTTPAVYRPDLRGVMAFKAIVTIVRNRTKLDYQRAFNKVLAANADLLKSGDPCDIRELIQLRNRAYQATGLSGIPNKTLVAQKVAFLVNKHAPELRIAPVEMQWTVLCRAVEALEAEDIPKKLLNRSGSPDVSSADWKTANAREDAVLALLEEPEKKPNDFGATEKFQRMPPKRKSLSFQGQIQRMVSDDGLTIGEAFAKLKEQQPIFWTHSILSFEPEKK